MYVYTQAYVLRTGTDGCRILDLNEPLHLQNSNIYESMYPEVQVCDGAGEE